MPQKQPIIKELIISAGIEPISADYPAKIIAHGTMYMIRVPMDVIDYFDLQPGDTLQVRLVSVRRIKKEGA